MAQEIRDYELVMVLSPEATEDEVTAAVERTDGLITDGGGTVGEHDTWGLRPLAYPIRNFQEGNYVLTRFALGANAVQELNRNLTASEEIIRFLVTKAESTG